jgi:hypothetical protein
MYVARLWPAAWPNDKKLKKAPIDAALARPKQYRLTEVEPANLIQVVDGFTSRYHPRIGPTQDRVDARAPPPVSGGRWGFDQVAGGTVPRFDLSR